MGTTTSIFDRVSGLLGGGFVLGQLSDLIKLDSRQTHQAIDRTVALLIGAMADRLEDDAEPAAVERLLSAPEMWVLTDTSRHILNPHAARGGEVVATILGHRWEDHVADLAMSNRLGPRQFAHLVNRIAPVVVAGVVEQQQGNDLDGEKLALLLAYERDRLIRIGLLSVPPGPTDDQAEQAGDARSTSDLVARATRNVAKVRAPEPASPRSRVGGPLTVSWMWWAVGTAALVFVLAWVLSRSVDPNATPDLAAEADDAETAVVTDEQGDEAVTGPTIDETTATDEQDEIEVVEPSEEGEVLGESSLPDDQTPTASVNDEEDESGSTTGQGDGEADDESGTTDGTASGTSLNETLELDTVTFQILSSVVTNSGLRVLDQVVGHLSDHPGLRVEIGGHTDNDGTDDKNLKLSQARADAVARYLESQGIDRDRLVAVGYGEGRPKVPNDSTVNKAVNRRIEFIVL